MKELAYCGVFARLVLWYFLSKGRRSHQAKAARLAGKRLCVCIWNTVTVGFCESTRYTQEHTPTGLFLSRQWSTPRVDKAKRGVAFSYTRRK